MSDLAPFVAATLRDRTIYDLVEENKLLRQHRMTLQILGSDHINGNDIAVYHEDLLINGQREVVKVRSIYNSFWVLDFQSQRDAHGNKIKIPWRAFLWYLNVRVSGVTLWEMSRDERWPSHDLLDRGDWVVTNTTNGDEFSYTLQEESVFRITGELSGGLYPDVIIHKVFLKEIVVSSLLKEFVPGYSYGDRIMEMGHMVIYDQLNEIQGPPSDENVA